MVAIYKITSPSGKVYVGQSWNIDKRFRDDYGNLNGCKPQRLLYKSFMKYGVACHLFEIIQELPSDTTQAVLDNYEMFCWRQYKEGGTFLLNIREPGSRGKHSEESKIKMSLAKMGIKRSEETIQKMKAGYKPPKNRNYSTHSPEIRAKIKANRAKNPPKLTEAGRKKLSEAAKRKIGTKTGKPAWNRGLKTSEDTKRKQSLAKTGKKYGKRGPYKHRSTKIQGDLPFSPTE